MQNGCNVVKTRGAFGAHDCKDANDDDDDNGNGIKSVVVISKSRDVDAKIIWVVVAKGGKV